MFPLQWLVLVLVPLAVAQPAPPACCATKTVGGVSYTFVREDSAAMSYSCLSSCVYERDDQPGTAFCFAQGDQQVVCGDSTQGGAGYKFLAGLSYSWDSSNSPFCAAALVSARWVITSASCSYADSSVVSPNTVNVMMGSAAVSVDKVIVHSGYSQSGDENNIALWRLAQASKESPLCLPAQGSQQTGTARLVGWRINQLSGYLNEELGEKEVALVEDCGQPGRICSTFATTECGGDFGGPLVQGSNTLIGAAVSDSGCGGGAGGKGLFTQISEHTDWIKRMISDNGGGDVCTNR